MLVFVALTLLALEGPEVVVLRSRDAEGRTHETRTWIADDGGFSWIEAANPERPFLRHILADPDVELIRGGKARRMLARPLPPAEGHALIRRLLREKYGVADWWIGLLTDTSASTAIRLEPQVSR